MKNDTSETTIAVQPRQFGCGKGIFTYVAADFDETPPGFEEYIAFFSPLKYPRETRLL